MTHHNDKRRQFLKYSSLGFAAMAFPQVLLANQNENKGKATVNFNPDLELEFTAKRDFIPILNHGNKTSNRKNQCSL